MSWVLDANPVDAKAIKKYHKQHPREVELCFANLTRLERMLKQGVTLQQAMRSGFFSDEGGGCVQNRAAAEGHEGDPVVHICADSGRDN